MKILVKFPTRGRPEKFAKTLKMYQDTRASDMVHFLITIDADDPTMNNKRIIDQLQMWGNLTVQVAPTKGKINAINYGLAGFHEDYDILVLASDDMIPKVIGWDNRIIMDMMNHYPDGDGVLWYNDGYVGRRLNTLCILGTKYYRRFGYIYNPEYRALWCDNEFMEVADMLKKQTYFNDVIIKHENPHNLHQRGDFLNERDNALYRTDEATYQRRKQRLFDLVINTDSDITGQSAPTQEASSPDQPPADKPRRKRKSASVHLVGQSGDEYRGKAEPTDGDGGR